VVKKPANHNAILDKVKETPSKDDFDLHYWADYIEIKCLFSPDAVFTRDDFIDCINSNKDFTSKNSGLEEYDADDESPDVYEEQLYADKAYKNDKEERFAEDCFKILESRLKLFNEYYPFTLSDNRRAMFRNKTLTWKHRCYSFLLFSSALKYVQPYQSVLTSSFEIFSLFVLKTLLPAKAEAHLFGAANSIIKDKRYKGHIWLKLNQLKTDLNEELIKAKKTDFSATDSGDSGFDFIAWIPNGDNQSHLISFTGQAACTHKWADKKYTSSASALRSLIPVSVPPINLAFIPFSVRNMDGTWHRSGDIGECVLLDRQRLLNHFENDRKAYLSLPCDKVIMELLKLKETAYN
jgi:hypothetical protein